MKLCRKKDDGGQEGRAAENRTRGSLNKATEHIQGSDDALSKIRKRTEKPEKKGKKKK